MTWETQAILSFFSRYVFSMESRLSQDFKNVYVNASSIACAAIKSIQTGLRLYGTLCLFLHWPGEIKYIWYIKTNTRTDRHTHTHTSLNLQKNRLAVKQCRHNQNGKPGWEPSIQLSGRNDNNTIAFGSRGRLRQTEGEEGTPTLWRLFFKVWQLQPASDWEDIWV